MAKKLIENEVINITYKAIETHVNLLKEFDVHLGSEFQKDKLETSINYLIEAMSLLKPIEDDLKELKRKAYRSYKESKEVLQRYKDLGEGEVEKLEKLEKDTELKLRLYIAYKEGT